MFLWCRKMRFVHWLVFLTIIASKLFFLFSAISIVKNKRGSKMWYNNMANIICKEWEIHRHNTKNELWSSSYRVYSEWNSNIHHADTAASTHFLLLLHIYMRIFFSSYYHSLRHKSDYLAIFWVFLVGDSEFFFII